MRWRRSGGRCASRAPFSTAAPTSTGSAVSSDSSIAAPGENPRARAAARVAPARETPGASAAACASPSQTASAAVASAAARGRAPTTAERRRATASPATSATEPATSPAAVARGPPSRCSIGRSNASPSTAAGASAITGSHGRASTARPRARASGKAVPAWSATAISLRSDPLRRACSQPSSQGTSSTCADDEIGSSSAGPWSSPRATGFSSAAPARRRRLRTIRKITPITIAAATA